MKITDKQTSTKWSRYKLIIEPNKKPRVEEVNATFQEVLEKAMWERHMIERVNARRMS